MIDLVTLIAVFALGAVAGFALARGREYPQAPLRPTQRVRYSGDFASQPAHVRVVHPTVGDPLTPTKG